MKRVKNFIVLVVLLLSATFTKAQDASQTPKLNLSDFKYLRQVEERYQSFNVEMCEVVGGRFWIPYDLLDSTKVRGRGGMDALKREIPAVNLYDKKLRMLTAALGPTYIRVSGTWANKVYFQDDDQPEVTPPKGYDNVLTRKQWKGVIDFCKAVNGELVTSFAFSDGMRDAAGNWTPAQKEPLVNYTKSIGGKIVAAEMFNEPSHASYGGAPKGYDAQYFARDFAAFKKFANKAVPEMKIMGPGSTGDGGMMPGISIFVDSIFSASPKPEVDIFSYHFYGALSKRCFGRHKPEDALTKEWLTKTELGFKPYREARDKYQPDAPIWLTETAEASCGGNPWAATYIDCFRYLEQLARLARLGVDVVMHNTLCASEYAVLEQETHTPRPNYWAALLWSKLMGTEVYETGIQNQDIDVFAHKLKDSKKGFAVLVVNYNTTERSIEIPHDSEQYLLTADELQTKQVRLNGKVLALTADDQLPEIKGEKIKAGKVILPANSIMFLAIK